MKTTSRALIRSAAMTFCLAAFVLPGPLAAAGTPESESAEPATTEAPAAAFVMIPHDDIGKGDLRTETVAAATRLKGLVGSFNADSFISHILYVTGVAEKDAFRGKAWATGLTGKLKKAGVLKTKTKPMAGDLVVFSLSPGAPHSARASKITIGIVEKVMPGRIDFILAGSDRVIRGTLKTGKGKVKETKLTSCTVKTEKPSKKQAKASKSGKSAGKGKSAKAKKSSSDGKTVTKNVPCRASELLVGFADIDAVALVLNPAPPTPPFADVAP